MPAHKGLTGADIHVSFAYTYANAAARLAASGFVAADVGKFALQSDNSSIWMLSDDSPITWAEVSGAPLASPTFTGTPAAPTAAGGTSTTQIATTAFVASEVSTHSADTTSVHGIADTSALLDTSDLTASHNHTSASADGGVLTNDEHDGFSEYAEIASPSTPASGKVRLYPKSDGLLYSKDDAGTETLVSGGAGGGGGALTVEEVDGSPTDSAVTKIVFPNGTLGIASHVATYTPSGGGSAEAHILIVESQASGTQSGTFTSGAWRTRVLNTEKFDTGNNATLASNQITLAAGTYRVRAHVPGYNCSRHQARLYDITNSAVLVTGTNAFCAAGSFQQTTSEVIGRFTLAGSTVLELQHQCETSQANDGLGVRSGNAFTVTEEIYATIELWKE